MFIGRGDKNEDLKNSFESYEVLYNKFSEKINSLREDAAKKQEMGQSSTKEKLRKEKMLAQTTHS